MWLEKYCVTDCCTIQYNRVKTVGSIRKGGGMNIRKVVIPVAGWGTRSLPASKNIPKEMLPLYNKPVIQYIVEEALRAGIENVVFVTNRDKNAIEDHFDYNLQLESVLERTGKKKLLDEVRHVAEMVNVFSVRQKKQLGLGHAVLCARELVKDEPFAVMVGDDVLFGENVGMQALVRVASERKMPVVGVMEVAPGDINRYGIISGREIEPGLYRIESMVEKPEVGSVDSRLAIIGRYVLTPEIFDYLEKTPRGRGGEIQLTDALAGLARDRGMLAVKMGGIRFDAGDWVDYLSANIYLGLQDPKLAPDLRTRLHELIRSLDAKLK